MRPLGSHIQGSAFVRLASPTTTASAEPANDSAAPHPTADRVDIASERTGLPRDNRLASAAAAAAIPGPAGACLALLSREIDVHDIESWDKAEAYYDRVRECRDDVDVIAANTPYSKRQVTTIKEHLFLNSHILDEGERRFDADPLIANAWSRLQQGTHGPKDLQLMEHELFEARFEQLFDTDYRTAHAAADRSGRPSGLYA